MPYFVFTDGGTRGNPGPAAAAAIIQTPNKGKVTIEKFLPNATNNEAEYEALIEALKWLNEEHILGQIVIKMDSQLVVRQVNGEYTVRQETLLPYWETAVGLFEAVKERAASVQLIHIPRAENVEADALCNKIMDAHGAVFQRNERKKPVEEQEPGEENEE